MRPGVLLAAFLVVGCGGNPPAPTPAPAPAVDDLRARCAAALGKAAATGRGDEQFSPADQKFGADVEAAMADGCAATKWPDVVLMCLTNGRSREELRSCPEMLTPVQREDFMERVLVVTKAHEAAAAPAP